MLLSSNVWLYLRLVSGMPRSFQVSGLEFCVHFEKHSSRLLFYNEVFCEFAREQSLKPLGISCTFFFSRMETLHECRS